VFDARGIEIPFPHVTLYLGEAERRNGTRAERARRSDRTASAKGAQPDAAQAEEPA
jgi:hypothetical protein